MPNVIPYTGLAKGNGFPFCLERVNVADRGDGQPFEYWSTLGGTNGGNVAGLTSAQKAANISLSWQNAWRLYWMLYRVNGTHYTAPSTPLAGVKYKIDFTDAANNEHSDTEFSTYKAAMSEPINRNCPPSVLLDPDLGEIAEWELGVPYSKFPVPHGLHSNFYVDSEERKPITRMYNGSTANESNFVGYGITSDWETLANAASGGGINDFDSVGSGIVGSYLGVPPDTWVGLLSYASTVTFSSFPDTPIGYGNIPIAVNGVLTGESIPCVVCIYTDGDGVSGNPVAVTDTDARSSLYESTTDSTYREGVQIDSIEFYTYP